MARRSSGESSSSAKSMMFPLSSSHQDMSLEVDRSVKIARYSFPQRSRQFVGTFWSQQHAKVAVAAPLHRHRSDRWGRPVRLVAGRFPAVDLRTSPGQDHAKETHVGLLEGRQGHLERLQTSRRRRKNIK
jgi:hypothetical protein